MALKKSSTVANLNGIVYEYLERLGMREEAKREFVSKANAMIGLESFQSPWFERMTAQLYGVLQQIRERDVEIDLNEPAVAEKSLEHTQVLQMAAADHEDEGRTSGGKRKRVGRNIRHVDNLKNKAVLIPLSDSDTD